MKYDYSWKIGGQAGEGIDTTGDIFSESLTLFGLHVFTHREFPSRIRGGYTSYEVRFSDEPVYCKNDKIDFVIAFDQETIDSSIDEMKSGSIIIYNSSAFSPDHNESKYVGIKLFGIALSDIAQQVGSNIMKNVVSLGVTTAMLGLNEDMIYNGIKHKFGKKGEEVLKKNIDAVEAGYNYVIKNIKSDNYEHLYSTKNGSHLFVSGSETVALGAIAGGCRFYAGYPITPATTIMEWLVPRMTKFGGTVVQAEDEISAINMVIGAEFAGARAMTATSGPGLDLMTESISLASMIETPAVIVDVQRAGPSTGLPTKHEQSDLWQAIFAGHGDAHRIVLTASTPENAFVRIQEAFNMSDIYQTPVILLLDQDLCVSKRSVSAEDFKILPIVRGNMPSDNEILMHNQGLLYKRYMYTDNGISPRTIPSQKNGLYLATGDEHDEEGHIIEDHVKRVKGMNKRSIKYDIAKKDMEKGNMVYGNTDADVALIGFGSTYGPVMNLMKKFKAVDKKVKYIDLSHIWPFPQDFIKSEIENTTHNIVIENNEYGQLYKIMRMFVKGNFHTIRTYDGAPFKPETLYNRIREVIS